MVDARPGHGDVRDGVVPGPDQHLPRHSQRLVQAKRRVGIPVPPAADHEDRALNPFRDAADRAVQVFGGRGFLEAFRPGRHFQDTRVCRLYEGTDEILTLKIAAAVLGKEWQAF